MENSLPLEESWPTSSAGGVLDVEGLTVSILATNYDNSNVKRKVATFNVQSQISAITNL